MAIPRTPGELKTSGRRLWRQVMSEYELEEHERQLLLEMSRTADALDRLATLVADEGDVVPYDDSGDGRRRLHPALVEARQLRIAYARLSAALRLPAGEEGDELRRPQRRAGVRGVYGLRAIR